MQAGDAVACAMQIPPIRKALDDVGLARLTTFMLTVYFVLAVSFDVKARDWSPGLVAAATFLGLYGAMTVKGPSVTA